MINRNDFASIGEDVFIHDQAIIKHPGLVKLGSHIAIDNGVTVSTQLEVGDYVHISPFVCLWIALVFGSGAAKMTHTYTQTF